VAEEECGSAVVNEMATEPYFVDFLREPPEPTGIYTCQSSPYSQCVFIMQSFKYFTLDIVIHSTNHLLTSF
jgi:hypothetical protein